MEINLRKIGEFCIIDLPAEIFLKSNIEFLKKAIEEILEEGFVNILLNMSKLSKIDGTGLGALLNIQKSVLLNNANMRLYDLQPYVANMLFQTRMNRIFDIVDANNEIIEECAALDHSLIA